MNNANDLVKNYLAIWNESDGETRRALIAQTWEDTANYIDPMFEVGGHDGIDAMVAGFQGQFPGLTFRQLGETEVHHDRIRFSWELLTETEIRVAAGTDVAVICNSKLQDVTGFFDQAPMLDAA